MWCSLCPDPFIYKNKKQNHENAIHTDYDVNTPLLSGVSRLLSCLLFITPKQLHSKMIHIFSDRFTNRLIQIETSECVSQIVWFRSGLQNAYRKSFDSDQDFRMRIANHLIQIGTSECVSQIIWFRSGLQNVYRKSFDSDRDFRMRIASHLIQIGTSECVSHIIWFRSGLQNAGLRRGHVNYFAN